MDEIDSHVLRKFEILNELGRGSYGIVWKAVNRKTNEIVTLKKIFAAFQSDTDARCTFREVMFLQEMHHDNIVRLFNVIRAENNRDLYLVFEYLDTDLFQAVRSSVLVDAHKQFISYQLLKALKYLHSAQLLHRNLMPSSCLLNSECRLRVTDFGLVRSISDEKTNTSTFTELVTTRWYQAPELQLGSLQYGKSVDIWAAGCIIAEMLLGKPVFPGTSTVNQLELIMELQGRPTQKDIDAMHSALAATMLESVPFVGTKQIFDGVDDLAKDLVLKMLKFNPDERITAVDALKHPWLAKFHDEANEPMADGPVKIAIRDGDKKSLSEYRDLLYAEIIKRKKEVRGKDV